MTVQQFDYLSDEAIPLRRRDGVPPWGIHVTELDSVQAPAAGDSTMFARAYGEAVALRLEIESTQ